MSGSQKRNEELIKVKDDKIKQSQLERDKAQDDLRVKERECRELRGRLSSLEAKIPQLLNKIDTREKDLKQQKFDNEELKYKLRVINEENFSKMIEMEKLSTEIVESNLNLQDKQQELESLELKFEELCENLNYERENTRVLENKLKEALKVLDQCQRESASTVNKSANDCGTDVTDSDQGSDEISYNEELFTDQSQISDGSCVSESEYDVSAGTMAKV